MGTRHWNAALLVTPTYVGSQSTFNKEPSGVRITIEQLSGQTSKLWAGNRYKYSQQVGSSPVAAYYMVAVILTNVKTCVDMKVAQYFSCKPPTPVEYLGNIS